MLLTSKIYIQLEPDDAARAKIKFIQESLHSKSNLVAEKSLHMTIIHIGLVRKLLDSLAIFSPQKDNEILSALDSLVARLTHLTNEMNDTTFSATANGYDFFGDNKSTFVIRFDKTDQLDLLHRDCLLLLKDFLQKIGVADVDTFMTQDHNLRHALSLLPHVTIAQSYQGIKSTVLLKPMKFHIMPVLYQV